MDVWLKNACVHACGRHVDFMPSIRCPYGVHTGVHTVSMGHFRMDTKSTRRPYGSYICARFLLKYAQTVHTGVHTVSIRCPYDIPYGWTGK